MEEVDAYIEQQCKKLNCSFVENADSKDVEFDTRNAFEFLIRCIWQIEPSSEAELPSCELPRHLPTRFRLAKTISDYLEKLGIRGDIGFQNLLYGSLNSLRNIFVDLIRKLPNDSGDVDLESTKTTATEQLSTEPKWVPEFCSRLKMSYDGRFWCPDELGMPELFSFVSKSSNANGMVEDPRNWIAKLLQDTEIDNEANVPKQKRPKPALPPKPKNLSATKEDDLAAKRALLEAALEEREAKRIEFLKVQIESAKVKSSLLHSKEKLKGFDRRLLEALEDPNFYKEQMIFKLEEMDKKGDADAQKAAEAKKDVESQLKEKMNRMDLKSSDALRTKKKQLLETRNNINALKEEIREQVDLLEKMENRIKKGINSDFSLMDRRCRDMEEIVKKQEEKIKNTLEERTEVLKHHLRQQEKLDRLFAIIYNFLSQSQEQQKGKNAMLLFLRFQLAYTEIVERLKENGAATAFIQKIDDQIVAEKQQKSTELQSNIDQDIREIEMENDSLIKTITELKQKSISVA